jgi:hypothetical protein
MNYFVERRSILLASALIPFLLGAEVVAQPAPTYRVERHPIAGNAELVTLFGRVQTPGSRLQEFDVPLLSVLRDTLGDTDPENDRLRYVWILTDTRPTPLQRAASALSFFYFRAGSRQHSDLVPKPVLDLASPARNVWVNLLGAGVQTMRLDALGAPIRASTRSYRGNSSDYRKLQVFRALGAMDNLARETGGESVLSDEDIQKVYSRLRLSGYTFGGLVRDENLSRFFDKESSRLEQMRGHNWELLRQRAEFCGLYFEPLAASGSTPNQAMLWVARDDLERREQQRFDGQFLRIANPWTDLRLIAWNGYTELRYFDAENRPVDADTAGARAVEMIPLALYSLDYPRVPLLLADFRDIFKPKRRELLQHGLSTVLTGVLGVTGFGNWSYMAANSAWTFVRQRHGAPMDRFARLRAYSEAREFLAVDTTLDPQLKLELERRLNHLALNPLENGLATEAKLAQEQYAALLRYAESPGGLSAKMERERRKELASYTRSHGMRLLLALGRLFTARPDVEASSPDPALLAKLDVHRRAAHHVRYLERLLASSPRPEVIRDSAQIRQAIDALSVEPAANRRAPRLIAQVFERSGDADVRMTCLRALHRLDVEPARHELLRLAQDPGTAPSWRTLCLLYFRGETGGDLAGVPGQQ